MASKPIRSKYRVHTPSKGVKYVTQKPIEDNKYDNSADATAFAAADFLGTNTGYDGTDQVLHGVVFYRKIR